MAAPLGVTTFWHVAGLGGEGSPGKLVAVTIAYTPDDFTQATSGGIPDFGLDRWRRSTAQAVIGLAKIPLGEDGAGRYLLIVPSRGLLGRPARYDLLPLSHA